MTNPYPMYAYPPQQQSQQLSQPQVQQPGYPAQPPLPYPPPGWPQPVPSPSFPYPSGTMYAPQPAAYQLAPPMPPGYGAPQQGYGSPIQASPPAPGSAFWMPHQGLLDQSYATKAAREAEAQRARAGGGTMVFFKIPGPTGQEKWDQSVPPGYENSRPFRALPSWAENTLHYAEGAKHFWKSAAHPQGAGLWCPGVEVCRVCQARQRALDSGNEQLVEVARTWGKPKRHYLYQGFATDDLQSHYDKETGLLRPQVLDSGQQLHDAIIEIQKTRGFAQIFHPVYGRNLRIKKKKTGTQALDIEYFVLDEDASVIPPDFHPEALNLYDLSKIVKLPTEADMMAAVSEMRLDFAGMPMSYSQSPNPPYANPYGHQPPQEFVFPTPVYTGTQLPNMGMAPPAPVPLPMPAPAMVGAQQYAPQPSRAVLPPGPPPPPASPTGGIWTSPPMSTAALPGGMSTPPPAPAGMSTPPGYIHPDLAALEAQLRGQAAPSTSDGAFAPPSTTKSGVPF